jgi:hypothetical protein
VSRSRDKKEWAFWTHWYRRARAEEDVVKQEMRERKANLEARLEIIRRLAEAREENGGRHRA